MLHLFFVVFWQAYGIYRIQTSKKKKGKEIGEANIRHSWFSMVWHPKAEPQENTSAPPDLHQTVTTITGLPKKKINDNYLCAHGMCSCSCNNFMDAAIITLSSSTPPDTCRTCKTAFSIFYLLKELLRDKHRQKEKESVSVRKDKINKERNTDKTHVGYTHTHTHTHVRAHTYACTRTHIYTKQAKERCGQDCCESKKKRRPVAMVLGENRHMKQKNRLHMCKLAIQTSLLIPWVHHSMATAMGQWYCNKKK